jgi:ATP-dependent RNA helicase DDX52/ROK1
MALGNARFGKKFNKDMKAFEKTALKKKKKVVKANQLATRTSGFFGSAVETTSTKPSSKKKKAATKAAVTSKASKRAVSSKTQTSTSTTTTASTSDDSSDDSSDSSDGGSSDDDSNDSRLEDEDEDGGVSMFKQSKDVQQQPAAFKAEMAKKKQRDAIDDETSALRDEKRAQRRVQKALRKEHGIHVSGADVPDAFESFDDLEAAGVSRALVGKLRAPVADGGCGFERLTPVQMQALPILLAGRELLACAPTGSGKTAAFCVPMLAQLGRPAADGLRALVLAPTRELSQQIYRFLCSVGRGAAGSANFHIMHLTRSNANANTFGADSSPKKDVLVATPLRLGALLKEAPQMLANVQWLVLDEADRLFDMGFLAQIDAVMQACSSSTLRRALFSATMLQGVETLARTVLNDPVRMTIGHRNAAATSIDQSVVFVGREDGKLLALRQHLQQGLKPPVLVFVQSANRAAQLAGELKDEGVNVDCIHSERTQAQREQCIARFRAGELWVLVCTDLLSRGIDFKGVNCVINYDFPQSSVSYIHRIGRTGRGDRKGRAITYFTKADTGLLQSIASIMRHSGCEVPAWMLALQPLAKDKRTRLESVAPARAPISTTHKSKKAMRADADRKRKKRKRDADDDGKGGGGDKKTVSASQVKKKKAMARKYRDKKEK